MVGLEGILLVSGVEHNLYGQYNNATEANAQMQATEAATFSNLRTRIASGGSGTNNLRFRNAGANGNQLASISGTGSIEDTVNTDAVSASALFNIAYTDTGTDSQVDFVAANVSFSSGHGNFHGIGNSAGTAFSTASTTFFVPISGIFDSNATTTIANAQWKNRGYTSIEAFQIRVTSNARTTNTTVRFVLNGTPTGTTITYGSTATGLQAVTGMAQALADGDLLCLQITTGTGTGSFTVSLASVTLKSTNEESDIMWGRGGTSVTRAASATKHYYLPGQTTAAETTETTERVKPGFPARARNLRAYLSANTYGAAATLKLFVNGVALMTTTIGAGGGAAWYENTTDSVVISGSDEISFEIVGGSSGSITIQAMGITFAPYKTEQGSCDISDGRVGSQQGLCGIEAGLAA